MSRRVFALVLTLSFATAPAVRGGAGPSKAACAEAYKTGQVQRRDGELRAAAKSFAVCADAACPTALRKDCEPWWKQAEASIPSILVQVSGAKATVRLDGEPIEPGKSIALDPGTHVVRAEAEGFEPAEATVKVRAGEHDVPVSLTLQPKPKAAEPTPTPAASSRPMNGSTLAFGALGLLSIGAFTYFGLHGNAAKRDLESCKPACDPARVDDVKRDYVIANVSLGLGAVMLGIATYTFVTRPSVSDSAPQVGVAVLPGFASVSWTGRF